MDREIDFKRKNEIAKELSEIVGHPIYTFTKENVALERLLISVRGAFNEAAVTREDVMKLRQIAIHYAKKGDLLYPHLKVAYEVEGPSDVMWTEDDEIRDELIRLSKAESFDPNWYERFEAVLKRLELVIPKENNILFPMCAVFFTKEEWVSVYRDSKDYDVCFGVKNEVWEEAEEILASNANMSAGYAAVEATESTGDSSRTEPSLLDGEIVMPGGHMSVRQLTAMLNTIPLEISFVDENNINRYFNEGPKVFKRPGMAIDREVFSCHPPKIEPMVRSIITSFREGTKDSVPVWMDKGGRTMLVTYMAVRDKAGEYLGTMELVQDMEFAKEHFAKAGDSIKMPDPTTLY